MPLEDTRRFSRFRIAAWVAVGMVAWPLALAAQKDKADDAVAEIFAKTEVMIPMRDGVKLHTEIFVPRKSGEQLPFLLTRTPYGVTDDKGKNHYLDGSYNEFFADGYIFVFQDIRGRYKSEGQFVMFRPPRSHNETIDEGTDTYDTIEWLLKNVPNNNGRVGILGGSYGGWLTVMAMLEPHPALKAASEQASPADQFLGDDFHHNGAFRLSYGVEYAAMMETGIRISISSSTSTTRLSGTRHWARHPTSIKITAMKNCPPGTISWRIRITTSSGRSKLSGRTSTRPKCRT